PVKKRQAAPPPPRRDTRFNWTPPPAIGGDPVNTAASFQQVVNYRSRQSPLRAVINEAMAVIAAQPVPGAEPEEAARVSNNKLDESARQAISRRVGFNRQLLSPAFDRTNREQYNQPKKENGRRLIPF